MKGNRGQVRMIKKTEDAKIWYEYKKGKGECLIFLHGLTGSSSAWRPISSFLEKRGYSTLHFDFPGHGLSDKPKDKAKYSFEYAAQELSKILNKLKLKKIILVGHSYGGLFSQYFYKKHPEKIYSLILISTTYGVCRDFYLYFLFNISFVVYKILSLLFFMNKFSKNKEHIDYSLFRGTHDFSPKRLYYDLKLSSFKTILDVSLELRKHNFKQDLKEIKVPVLIIHGNKDLNQPVKVAHTMHSLIKDSELILFDTNHISVINEPEKIRQEILRYLQEL